MIEWLKQNLEVLACFIVGIVPVIVAIFGLRFTLSNRVTRLETLLNELKERELPKLRELQSQLHDLQSKMEQQPAQGDLPSQETLSIELKKTMSSLSQELKQILDDVRSHSSGPRKDAEISLSETQGQTDLSIPMEEISNLEDSKAKKKIPKRKKKVDNQKNE